MRLWIRNRFTEFLRPFVLEILEMKQKAFLEALPTDIEVGMTPTRPERSDHLERRPWPESIG